MSDDTQTLGISCGYTGPFNSDPSCRLDLGAVFVGNGSTLTVAIGTDVPVSFEATVDSPTTATLVGYLENGEMKSISGTVELQQDGKVLVIHPTAPPFALDEPQCTFDRYSGTFKRTVNTP